VVLYIHSSDFKKFNNGFQVDQTGSDYGSVQQTALWSGWPTEPLAAEISNSSEKSSSLLLVARLIQVELLRLPPAASVPSSNRTNGVMIRDKTAEYLRI
jgi:hypothetical protein